MLLLALRAIAHKPLRSFLTLGGLAAASWMLFAVLMCDAAFRRSLQREMQNTGMELMLVPIGCPYDAAAQIARGRALDASLPASALDLVRHDPAVAVAAPVLSRAIPRHAERRTDLWVGIDGAYLRLKPWLRLGAGSTWFTSPDSIILGWDAAQAEMRHPGDLFANPRTGQVFRVCGVFLRTGGSDDSLFFVPLPTAQKLFGQKGRLTAISIRLKDPAAITEAAERLQRIRGAQVVTLTEVMGTFLNLLSLARSFAETAVLIALVIASLTVFNTMMASVMERAQELAVMRAVGASRLQVFLLTGVEGMILCVAGALAGFVLAYASGGFVLEACASFLGIAPGAGVHLQAALPVLEAGLCLGAAAGLATIYPALRAATVPPAVAMRA
ncbi:MAG: ABC transporter permease [Chthonomonadales bacterium]